MNIDRLNNLKVNNEGFAFDTRTGDTYSINATGLLVMKGLKAGATTRQIIGQLEARFNVDLQTVYRDLERFFSQLERNNLIKTEAAA